MNSREAGEGSTAQQSQEDEDEVEGFSDHVTHSVFQYEEINDVGERRVKAEPEVQEEVAAENNSGFMEEGSSENTECSRFEVKWIKMESDFALDTEDAAWDTAKRNPPAETSPAQAVKQQAPEYVEEPDLLLKVECKDEVITDNLSFAEGSEDSLLPNEDKAGLSICSSVSEIQVSTCSNGVTDCHKTGLFAAPSVDGLIIVTKCKLNKRQTLHKSSVENCSLNTGWNAYNTCEKDSSLSSNLKEHKHITNKTFQSSGRCLTRSDHFTYHPAAHCTEKVHKCEVCGKCFKLHSRLKIHLRTHSGKKNYKCEKCGKFFTYSGTLAIHLRIHSGQKDFKCEQCGKCFNVRWNLNTHLRTHSDKKEFKCEKCGKCFRLCSHLKLHLRTHSDEKNYKCNECGKCYKHRSNLAFHMKIHTDKRGLLT